MGHPESSLYSRPSPCWSDVASHPLTGIRALVVDDHQDSRDALRLMLESLGATVSLAGTGRDALRIAAQNSPHLVLCDIRMPGMDGFAVLAGLGALPASHPPIRVIAVTGLGRDTDIERTRAAGFDGHLVKPLDYDLLVTVLARVLAGD
jgi:CheY-like chemotaxis protein